MTVSAVLTLLDTFVFVHESGEQIEVWSTLSDNVASAPVTSAPTSDPTPVPLPTETAAPVYTAAPLQTFESAPAPTAAPVSTEAPTPVPDAVPVRTEAPTPAATAAPVVTPTPAYDEPVITDMSYNDGRISVTITESVYTSGSDKTTYYIADIRLASPEYLKTSLASGSSFRINSTAKVSEQAKNIGAILAINGDGCGQERSKGYVVRNGVAYRQTSWTERDKAEDLVIHADGAFEIIDENITSANDLKNKGSVAQVFSFGPALINNGVISVSQYEEITGSRTMANNPRTAIGMVEPLHYVIVVSDGRTRDSKGLSLHQMAEIMLEAGCKVAYNMDGGGSSTLWFNNRVINYPTTNGKYSERKVSDIVYIGY